MAGFASVLQAASIVQFWMPKSIGCGELGESRPRTVGIRHSANASARFASLSLVKIKVTGQMRRLLVAAAVSLASASEPFSWADAQAAMHSCTNGSRPLVDKYAYLVESRRDADRATATYTETPARARTAGAFETSPPCWTAETSRP